MTRIADALFYLPKIAAALCLAVMILLVFGNVVLRHAASGGFAMAEELSGWCLVWIIYFAGLIALSEHGHLGFDAFVKALTNGTFAAGTSGSRTPERTASYGDWLAGN